MDRYNNMIILGITNGYFLIFIALNHTLINKIYCFSFYFAHVMQS